MTWLSSPIAMPRGMTFQPYDDVKKVPGQKIKKGWGHGRSRNWFKCFECKRKTYNVKEISDDRVGAVFAVICGNKKCHLYDIAVCYERDI